MKNQVPTHVRTWSRTALLLGGALVLGLGCSPEEGEPAPDAGVAEGTGYEAEAVAAPLLREVAPDEGFLVEFEGFVSPRNNTFEVRVLDPDEWMYLDPVGPDGMAMRRNPLNDYCHALVNRARAQNEVTLNTIAGSVATGNDCPRTPIGGVLLSYFLFDDAFCANVRMRSKYTASLSNVLVEIVDMSSTANRMYQYQYKQDYGLGNGAEPPSNPGNRGPTDTWGLVSYGDMSNGDVVDRYWIFRRAGDADFYFRGLVAYTRTEVANNQDDDCDDRIDEDTLSYPDGAGCETALDCQGGACDCFPDACDPDNGITPQCRSGSCGDNIQQANEFCDEGGSYTATCDANCTAVICGDNTVNPAAGEECDPGAPGTFTAACNINCTESECGDGIVNAAAGEECDDQNTDDFDGCTSACRLAFCGDGLRRVDVTSPSLLGYEECDLGSGNNGLTSACPNCRDAICGDGRVRTDIVDSMEPGYEFCDGDGAGVGGETAACNANCTAAACGDGVTNLTAGEVCDTAGNSDTCDVDCSAPSCGDGYVNSAYTPPSAVGPEQCDLGAGNANGGACTATCQVAVCGDGHVRTGLAPTDPGYEVCDSGLGNSDTADGTCRTNCRPAVCGDGVLDSSLGEQCDAGSSNADTSGAPCRTNCQLPFCGDGILDPGLGETCDTPGAFSNTGACRPGCIAASCGDGVVRNDIADPLDAAYEFCDQGVDNSDTNPGACRTDCRAAGCGDGVVDTALGEECDDGDLNSDTTPNACRTTCTLPRCGDGVADTSYGETCDNAGANSSTGACLPTCQAASCGDGFVRADLNPGDAGYEVCDAGAGNSDTTPNACRTTCVPAGCGDDVIDAGEVCDEGEENSPTEPGACRLDCTLFRCGDAVADPGEECDLGDPNDPNYPDPPYSLENSNTLADTCRTNCTAPRCGDGVSDTGESCDDGNPSNTDACLTNCQPAACGDGFVRAGVETCDDSNGGSGDGCSSACQVETGWSCPVAGAACVPLCGDGLIRGSEVCDDSNSSPNDGCSSTCQVEAGWSCNGAQPTTCTAICGDGLVRGPEQCDDGNTSNTDACLNTCVAASCGDTFVRAGVEECDDGNTSNNDACTNACLNARCGDGNVRTGFEQCDDGNTSNSDGCLNSCAVASCGDGFTRTGVEQCDDGNGSNTDACKTDCTAAACGDGFVRTDIASGNPGHEACDDGNALNTDGCLTTCQVAACGDGFVRAGVEECDDGNTSENDQCLNNCTAARCGDGVVLAGVEQCDDGNPSNTDGCTNSCSFNVCGDGFVNVGVEQCDDGNALNTDGCLNSCALATCGDSFVRTGVEECDDANGVNTDACTNACLNARCGDGIVRTGVEACDDGNSSNNDACLNTCVVATCGDSFVRTGFEACDDGNTSNNDACISCQNAFCGDGFVRSGVEECDTGPVLNPPASPGTARCESCVVDADGDGFTVGEGDCGPSNSAIYPGASDTVYFDAEDSNCDGFSGNAADTNIRAVQTASCAGSPFGARCYSSASLTNPLQSAINASAADQVVLVLGTVNLTSTTQLKDGVDLYGGWSSSWASWNATNQSTVQYTTASGVQVHAALWGYNLNNANFTDVRYMNIRTVPGTTDNTDNIATSLYGMNIGTSSNLRVQNSTIFAGNAFAGAAANNQKWRGQTCTAQVGTPDYALGATVPCEDGPYGAAGDAPYYANAPGSSIAYDANTRFNGVFGMGGQGNGWYSFCPLPNGSNVHPYQVIRNFSGQQGGHGGGNSIGMLLSNASNSVVSNNTIQASNGGAGGDGTGGFGPSAGGQGGHSVAVWILGANRPSGWPAIGAAGGAPEDCTTATAGTYGGNTLTVGSAASGGYASANNWDEGRGGFAARCHQQTQTYEWAFDCHPQLVTNVLSTTKEGWTNGGGFNFPGPHWCSPGNEPQANW